MSDTLFPKTGNMYSCAITNETEAGFDAPDSLSNQDGLQDLPPGWTAVVIKRRVTNPRYALIQEVKNAFIAGTISKLPAAMPADMKEAQSLAIQVQFDAQFSHLISTVPQYLTDHEVAFIAPVEYNDDLREVYNELRGNLGLPPISESGDIMSEEAEGKAVRPDSGKLTFAGENSSVSKPDQSDDAEDADEDI